jgi:hypothetical protein
MASPGFNGSSMMIRLPPSPVSVPSIEVAIRLPRLVVVVISHVTVVGLYNLALSLDRLQSSECLRQV